MSSILPWDQSLIEDKISSLSFSFDEFTQVPQTPVEKIVSKATDGDLGQELALYKPESSPIVSGENNNNARTIVIRLPVEEAQELQNQIDRIKKLIYPNEETKNVSDEAAWQCIIQAVINTNDSFFK